MKAFTFLFLVVGQACAFTPTSHPAKMATTSLSAHDTPQDSEITSRRALLTSLPIKAAGVGALVLTTSPQRSAARLDPVNRPDLLPTETGINVIQTEKFLTSGQVKRMEGLIAKLEKDTGFRLRVLCQVCPFFNMKSCAFFLSSHQNGIIIPSFSFRPS